MLHGRISRRVLAHIWLKTIGSTVAISAFFVGYFYVLNRPFLPARMMPLLGPDLWLPVLPWSAWIYFSLWVYICMPSSLMRTRRALGHYLIGALVLSVVGLTIFLLLPTAVPTWDIDWEQYSVLAFLKQSDASGNACPSLHVGFSVFSGLWMMTMLRRLRARSGWHAGNVLWCLAIVFSTLTTKQHVLVDVVCGAVLGTLVYAVNRAWSRRREVNF